MNAFSRTFREISQYPSAIVSLIIILLMLIVSVWVVIAIPYHEAVRLWRGGELVAGRG